MYSPSQWIRDEGSTKFNTILSPYRQLEFAIESIAGYFSIKLRYHGYFAQMFTDMRVRNPDTCTRIISVRAYMGTIPALWYLGPYRWQTERLESVYIIQPGTLKGWGLCPLAPWNCTQIKTENRLKWWLFLGFSYDLTATLPLIRFYLCLLEGSIGW